MIYFLEYPEDVDRKKIEKKLTLQMEVQGMIDIMDEKIHQKSWNVIFIYCRPAVMKSLQFLLK